MKKAQREKSEIWRKKSTQMDNGDLPLTDFYTLV